MCILDTTLTLVHLSILLSLSIGSHTAVIVARGFCKQKLRHGGAIPLIRLLLLLEDGLDQFL